MARIQLGASPECHRKAGCQLSCVLGNPAGCRRPEVHDNQDHRTSRRVSTILPFGLFTRPRSVGLDVSQRQTQCALLTPLARSPSKARRGGMRQRLRSKWRSTPHGRITHPGDRSRQYRRGWNTSRERQGEKIFSARPRSGPSQSRQVRRSLGQMDLSIRKLTHRFQIETINRTTRSGRLADVSELLSILRWQRSTSTPTHMQFRRRPQSLGGF